MIKAVIAPGSPRLQAALDRMARLHPKVIDLSLGRIETLLARLDHPERRLPPLVHVAGTNGKGSTVAFLRAMAEAGGYRVHAYTSPHLVHFHERIRLAGSFITDDDLATLLEEVEAANGDNPITFFEITTAAAFLAFSRIPADLLLLEVGLGGRLDATNVVTAPAVSLLTRISLDHTQFLGGTAAEIAAEKAGIIKPGRPALTLAQPDPAVLPVFQARAAALDAPLFQEGRDWSVEVGDGGDWRFAGQHGSLDLPAPGLPGEHQYHNAALAIAAIPHLPLRLGPAAIARGLDRVYWPARLQRLTRGPLPDLLPAGTELWLDGGHNDSAGEVLARHLAGWAGDGRPVDLVFGMLGSKRPDAFLRPLRPFVRHLRAVAIPGEANSLPAADIADLAHGLGFQAAPADSVAAALADLGPAGGDGRVLICGSLYLAGTVLRENG